MTQLRKPDKSMWCISPFIWIADKRFTITELMKLLCKFSKNLKVLAAGLGSSDAFIAGDQLSFYRFPTGRRHRAIAGGWGRGKGFQFRIIWDFIILAEPNHETVSGRLKAPFNLSFTCVRVFNFDFWRCSLRNIYNKGKGKTTLARTVLLALTRFSKL